MTELILIGAGVLLGAILCFNGYKLFRLCLAVAGGVLGYVGGTFVCKFIESTGSKLPELAKTLIPLIPALVLAIMAFPFAKARFKELTS